MAHPTPAGLGTQLQFLVAHGDLAFVETLADFVNKRVLNVLAMEAARRDGN